MRRERTVLGLIVGVTLVACSSFAFAQRSDSLPAPRPGPTPGPSSGMPSDLDTTGMGGGQHGCVAPPGGTASSTGGDVRTPANAGASQSRTPSDDPHVGTSQAAEIAAKAHGC